MEGFKRKRQTEEEKRNGCFNVFWGVLVAVVIIIYMVGNK